MKYVFMGCVDGDTTGLNAIAFAIIDAGFAGVRIQYADEKRILWEPILSTIEGRMFACLCDAALQEIPLPTIAEVLYIIQACETEQQ
jgi:hypothetical protein